MPEYQPSTEYQITSVNVLQFMVQPTPQGEHSNEKLNINVSLRFKVSPESSAITVFTHVVIRDVPDEVCAISTECSFFISNAASLDQENIATSVNLPFLAEIAHSTTRGILLSKLALTPWQGIILPLINKEGQSVPSLSK